MYSILRATGSQCSLRRSGVALSVLGRYRISLVVHPLKTRYIVGGSVIEKRVAIVKSRRNQGVDDTTRSFVVVGRYRLMWLMLCRLYEYALMTWYI